MNFHKQYIYIFLAEHTFDYKKTNEFINVLKKYYSFNLETVDNLEE